MSIRQLLTYVIIVSLICGTCQLSAQGGYVLSTDTSVMTIERTIPQQKINDYRSQPVYNYDENPDYSESFLDRLWLRFNRWLRSLLGESGYDALGNIIFFAVVFIAIAAVVVFVIRAQGHNPFGRTNRRSKTALAADGINENSSVESIDNLIAKAEAAEDYRLAIRLLYLKSLRLLDTAEEITWRSGKTNHDYLLEIKGTELREEFESLNYIYEYSWYGQFEIEGESQYHQLREPFIALFNKIIK